MAPQAVLEADVALDAEVEFTLDAALGPDEALFLEAAGAPDEIGRAHV